ncbi:MAG: hypothetical protein R3C42_09665 [Parvularculaceae bacterium]|nr:hypothetical protein [Parvularculaceae bacterium]
MNHIKKQNWTGVALDFVIVVLGVFIGIEVSNWNADRADARRAREVLAAIDVDLNDFAQVTEEMTIEASRGLAAFDEARRRGERPAPYYFRVSGSDTPPQAVWDVALQSNISELVPPSLVFDLGFFYSEQQGVGVKFIRYQDFIERQILPRLDDPSTFYDGEGRLKPAFEQNMARLHEWIYESHVLTRSSDCLRERFKNPSSGDGSCRPVYTRTAGEPAQP